MSELFLYDDAIARAFEPFALTRPVCELRAGALLLRERWEHALAGRSRAAGFVSSPHLADFDEAGAAHFQSGVLPKGSVLVNARCAVALHPVAAGDVWTCAGRVAAVVLSRNVEVAELASGQLGLDALAKEGGRSVTVSGRWMDHVWDFIAFLAPMLAEDIAVLAKGVARSGAAVGMVVGTHPVHVEDGATVEPQVYFDTTAGPVLVRRGATILAFTRIVGPCVVGEESQVSGDRISGCSIGNGCKAHGELSSTIFLGHSNKGHDGFVGHSYLGRWVNLGAGTITSNLKNTYGKVQLWTPGGEQHTDLQFLGTFFGDHAKTGIGMKLNTGTVLGAGANIYGSVMPPRAVAPFAWGDQAPYSTYRLDKFIEVARRVMARRQVELSDREVRQLTAAYERRWSATRAT